MSLGVVVLGGNWQRGSCPTAVKHLSHQMIHHRFERLKKSKISERIGERIGHNSVKSE